MPNKPTGWSLEMQGVLKDWPSVVDADGTLLARTYGPNAEAVARKMAAADTMLAALREITDAYLSLHAGEETFIAARALAAIAAAEGR